MTKYLIIKRLGISLDEYLFLKDQLFSESDLLYFRNACKDLLNNVPFQHIVGNTEFYGLELNIDSRALIPRPETEELVDWIVADFKQEQGLTILDVCSGSGCIALAIKHNIKDSIVQALEKSKDAVALIEENKSLLALDVTVFNHDVFDVNALDGITKSDVWVSNPPYIPNKDKAFMDSNVLDFDPEMALFVDDDTPLIFYSRIAELAKDGLKPNGALYFEIHESYGEELVEMLINIGFSTVELRKDLQGKDRFIKCIWKSK